MHDVKALVGQERWMLDETAPFRNAVICPLARGFALVPMTDSLAAELKAITSQTEAALLAMAPGVIDVALRMSQSSAVAYISTEYFGGDGIQDAIAWLNGDVIFSPGSEGMVMRGPTLQSAKH
ncbi:hypothetical protein [Luteibacter sp. 22Crub2.1]|uniref:hypothetical protein n=1 Tax=Luteibacter sp. 22Crub2.1 TaxID=1283288 RepID=UPI0009A8D782|nr:hypothetical protein [Luteibacter sp. 22Crub2.1]SKB69497.1 hypothetical protein SAMN05660880_02195 [Luteibacter sp. 22Crub2.1]